MPNLVKLLSDPQASVREVAVTTMVEIYRHVGEKMRADLVKKYSLPAAK
jgi:CLIP-associating protein 1/2